MIVVSFRWFRSWLVEMAVFLDYEFSLIFDVYYNTKIGLRRKICCNMFKSKSCCSIILAYDP